MVATATIDAFTAGHENLASTADAADVGETCGGIANISCDASL